MSSSSKRGRLTAGSSSSSRRQSAPFLNTENEEAYHKYKDCKIIPSKMLNQAALNFEVLSLFASTTFQFLLTLAIPYNSELLLDFFANLTYTIDNTTFHSLFVVKTSRSLEPTSPNILGYPLKVLWFSPFLQTNSIGVMIESLGMLHSINTNLSFNR